MRFVLGLVFAFASLAPLGCTPASSSPPPSGPNCGPGTVEVNGVCVAQYTPPPTMNRGNGATIYFWASASAGATAMGTVYAIVDGYTEGQLTGYATSGTPPCGMNAIYGVSISVAPGKSYSLSAHDSYTAAWPPFQTPTITSGECYSFRLN